jgi:hypothetical protein
MISRHHTLAHILLEAAESPRDVATQHLPQQWLDSTFRELSSEILQMFWECFNQYFSNAGSYMGNHPAMFHKHNILPGMDDEKRKAEAFIIYKRSKFGNNVLLVSPTGPALDYAAMLLQTPGWFGEPNKLILKRLQDKNVRPISDKDVVYNLLRDKTLDWKGKGQYTRAVPGLGTAERCMYGMPRKI